MSWDIKNKVCLITGATSGIGRQTALQLSKMGAKVVITYRNKNKADETKGYVFENSGVLIDTIYCDLSSFASVRECSKNFSNNFDRLDVLINNAGIWETRYNKGIDGHELNFTINHLSPFLLTNLLLDLLIKSAPSRIINLSSGAHKGSPGDFENADDPEKYSSFKSYSRSKLANILFTKALADRMSDKNITVNCLHPGVVSTNIFHKMNKALIFLMRPIMVSPERGAETSVYLSTSDEVSLISGKYFYKKKIVNSSSNSESLLLSEKLWNLSLKQVGL